MARHRQPRRSLWRRNRTPAPAEPPPSPATTHDEVDADSALTRTSPILQPVPTEPTDVRLAYPDGSEVPVGVAHGGRVGAREHWIASVPQDARLANGMVIRIERDTVLAVSLLDRDPGELLSDLLRAQPPSPRTPDSP